MAMNKGETAQMAIERLEAENAKLRVEVERLTGVADRANKAMEKYQKHRGALEIAIQEAHRDTDAIKLQISELKSLEKAFESRERALEKRAEDAERLNRAWERAINECCECGGKGPQDTGVCLACKVYHLARALADKRICERCCKDTATVVRPPFGNIRGENLCAECDK